MKAKIEALNKSYLVEFKDENQFVSFLTQHNDKINNVEVINEESLPELQKPVEVAKPSMSDGWKTLEKSAFTQKEKGVEKKGMTLGGKYSEFKYEPDKTLDNASDDKVSEPKSDSPALKGDEPKVANVETTAKEEKVEVKDSPKSEEHKEWNKEEKSEDKEEKKEVKESVEDETLTPEQIEEVKDYFKDLVEDKDNYPDYEAMIQAMRSLDSNGDISNEQYNYCLAHWDEWLSEFDPDNLGPVDEELNEVLEAAGVETDTIETAKQWVLQNVVKLQTLKKGEIASVQQRNELTKLLAQAASLAWGVSSDEIINSLAKSNYKI